MISSQWLFAVSMAAGLWIVVRARDDHEASTIMLGVALIVVSAFVLATTLPVPVLR